MTRRRSRRRDIETPLHWRRAASRDAADPSTELITLTVRVIIAAIVATIAWAGPSWAADPSEYSVAEKRLFVDDHLGNLANSATLEYAYSKRGSLEGSVDDKARLVVETPASTGGRAVKVEYLTDARKIELADVGSALGNPIILYFLEREVREMNRMTGGSISYYRKRIRMALAEGGQVEAVTVDTSVGPVKATRIRIAPYRDDPARSRYQRFAEKSYAFTLSDAVPGKVVELRSELLGSPSVGASAPDTIIVETLQFTGMH